MVCTAAISYFATAASSENDAGKPPVCRENIGGPCAIWCWRLLKQAHNGLRDVIDIREVSSEVTAVEQPDRRVVAYCLGKEPHRPIRPTSRPIDGEET